MTRKRKLEPVLNWFTSMGQAAADMGVPMQELKLAKKNGCNAFRGGRVNRHLLEAWLHKRRPKSESDEDKDWSTEKAKWSALRDKLRLKKEESNAIDFGEVRLCIARAMSVMFAQMERCFSVDLPPGLKGLDESAIQSRCMDAVEKFKERVRGEFAKIMGEDEKDEK